MTRANPFKAMPALIAVCLFVAACAGQPGAPSPRPSRSPTPSAPATLTIPSATRAIPRQTAPAPAPSPAAPSRELEPYALALRPSHRRDIDAFASATRYDIELTIEPATLSVTGRQTVRYTNRGASPLDDILLRLYPNTPYMGGMMRVDSALADGLPVTPTAWLRVSSDLATSVTDTSVIRLPLYAPLAAGHSVWLSMTFTLTAPQDSEAGYRVFGQANGVLSLPNAYPMIPPRDEAGWRVEEAPAWGDIVFSEAALYRARIRTPAGQVIVATGVCAPSPDSGGESPTPQQDVTCVAGPARDFALHLSDQFERTQTTLLSRGESITVSSYYLPSARMGATRALIYAAEAARAFERRFGPYPFKELKVFMSPTTAGGIEYPMLAGVTDALYDITGGYFEWVTAHEVAHQWWYALVGSDPIREAWLDEALTQYATSLYIEDRYGLSAAQAERERYFTRRYENDARRVNRDDRVGQPTGAFDRRAYGPLVYGKGPLFFQAVRDAAGDARFNAWLRAYFNRHRYGIATAEDLLRAADDVGIGPAARRAYQQWILGAGRPD